MDDGDRSEVELAVRPVAGSASRRPTGFLVTIVVLAVAIALIKPWGALPRPAHAPEPSAAGAEAPAGVPTPAPTPDSYAELVVTCGSPSGWRAATLQHWVGRESEIRTWSAIEPVAATSAADATIPFAPVATDLVTAIGFCVPRAPNEAPLDAMPQIWALAGSEPRRLVVARLEPPDANPLGGLWLPPADEAVSVDGTAGWPSGRYAIRLEFGPIGRWLGIEIENLAAPTRAPSPDQAVGGLASASPAALP